MYQILEILYINLILQRKKLPILRLESMLRSFLSIIDNLFVIKYNSNEIVFLK